MDGIYTEHGPQLSMALEQAISCNALWTICVC